MKLAVTLILCFLIAPIAAQQIKPDLPLVLMNPGEVFQSFDRV